MLLRGHRSVAPHAILLALCAVAWMSMGSPVVAEEDETDPSSAPPASVTLRDGSQLHGSFLPSESTESFLWQDDEDRQREPQRREISWSQVQSVRFGEKRREHANLSPLQQQRAQAETRRKAALRGAWHPKRDGEGPEGKRQESAPVLWENAIHLRGGDLISGRLRSIGSSDVHFETDRYGVASFPQQQVAAVELSDAAAISSLDETSRQRLMTVPRARGDQPPTHLVIAPVGDYLRGRLRQMDEQQLQFELATGEVQIPRERVCQIIWLNPPAGGQNESDASHDSTPHNESAGSADAEYETAGKEDEPGGPKVQVVYADGERVSLDSIRVDGAAIRGTHAQLGDCEIPLGDIAELVLEPGVASGGSAPGFDEWTLRAADLPWADRARSDQ